MNTQLLFSIMVNKQLVKPGKYLADFNYRGSRLTAKYREIWTTRVFPILRYNMNLCMPSYKLKMTSNFLL